MTSDPLRVALVGNPNSGKTTLFNALTRLRQKTGNYAGVTVEKHTGQFRGLHGERIELIDLPGAPSLHARAPDERIVSLVLTGGYPGEREPDAVICVADATNLPAHLYLLSQLAEWGGPVVLAVNMIDLAARRGLEISVHELRKTLGIPVIALSATAGSGLIELRAAVAEALEKKTRPVSHLPDVFRDAVDDLVRENGIPRLQAALWLTAPEVSGLVPATHRECVDEARARLVVAGFDPALDVVRARHRALRALCGRAVRSRSLVPVDSLSDRLDAVLTHRVFGWIVLAGVLGAFFTAIFFLAEYPMEWIDAGFAAASGWVLETLPPGDFADLVANGALAGVGGVVIFLPQILTMFLFLGFLEDSGYMARAAFLMDGVMARVGLTGKSFLPLVGSFACAIPGIMATRTIEHRTDRLITILVAPLMSCSARLPVFALMIAALLPVGTAWQKALILLAVYALGVAVAFGIARLGRMVLREPARPMMMLELPPYRLPHPRDTLLRMWDRGKVFLLRAGTVILAFSIILWALATYPKSEPDAPPSEALAESFAGRLGHWIEPAIRPLGYDWQIGIGLIASFAAREVFVSTMGIIYNVDAEVEDDPEPLLERIRAQQRSDGSPVFSPAVCIGLMVFFLFAMQCASTVAIVRRETGGWTWPIIQLVLLTSLAYVAALGTYQIAHLFGS